MNEICTAPEWKWVMGWWYDKDLDWYCCPVMSVDKRVWKDYFGNIQYPVVWST